MLFSCLRKKKVVLIAAGVIASLIVVAAVLLIYYVAIDHKGNALDPPNPTSDPPPSESPLGQYRNAAVSSNGYLCANIGRDVLLENGTAVDAALATLICEGVLCLQSMGVGGGFFMTIYQRANKSSVVLDARETAPAKATQDMFHGDTNLSQRGGLSIAIPGEIKGYYEAWRLYGQGVSWERLFAPTIEICKNGFIVSDYLANTLKNNEQLIRQFPGMVEILVDPKTNQLLQEGDLLKRPRLAETLQVIAKEGADAFYTGSLAQTIVDEIQAAGGIITLEDLRDYKVQWKEPVTATIGQYKMFSFPTPGSGTLVSFILNILNGFISDPKDAVTYHRIVEAFKYGYGKRTELGDISEDHFVPNITYVNELIKNLTSEEYAANIRSLIKDDMTFQDPEHYGAVLAQPEDYGTAQISVLAANGDAVSVTSTINLILGSMVRTNKTGIIYNDEMDDFSAPNITNYFGIPPSPANFIFPGKRPFSSMCPSIFVDEKDDVQLVTGAAGGSKITTATALIAISNLIFNQTIKEAIDARRFHHQLFPMEVSYEMGFLGQNVENLESIGHMTSRTMTAGSSVTGIARYRGNITANYDFRRGGSIAGY